MAAPMSAAMPMPMAPTNPIRTSQPTSQPLHQPLHMQTPVFPIPVFPTPVYPTAKQNQPLQQRRESVDLEESWSTIVSSTSGGEPLWNADFLNLMEHKTPLPSTEQYEPAEPAGAACTAGKPGDVKAGALTSHAVPEPAGTPVATAASDAEGAGQGASAPSPLRSAMDADKTLEPVRPPPNTPPSPPPREFIYDALPSEEIAIRRGSYLGHLTRRG